jgi:hypothetical protein|tara:strand:- start:2836 stop:2985 length:150 start_codon:yes stop_codon:yes gene_type:complete
VALVSVIVLILLAVGIHFLGVEFALGVILAALFFQCAHRLHYGDWFWPD